VRIKSLRWLGVPADRFVATTWFFRDVLGMELEFEEPDTAELSVADGSRVQVFARRHRYFDFYRQEATGPVPLFEVEDLGGARRELEAVDTEFVGEDDSDAGWAWFHFRAPDGNLYALGERKA
jgi:catechol 2,3-dioxygenase-like lactoylglutathione lyase family enzyme